MIDLADESHKNPRTKKEEYDKIIAMLEKSQLESEKLDESKVTEPSEDVDSSEAPFTEDTDGKIAPLEKSGSVEIDKSTRSKRFSIEHEETTTKDSVLREQLKKKVDKPSDEERSE